MYRREGGDLGADNMGLSSNQDTRHLSFSISEGGWTPNNSSPDRVSGWHCVWYLWSWCQTTASSLKLNCCIFWRSTTAGEEKIASGYLSFLPHPVHATISWVNAEAQLKWMSDPDWILSLSSFIIWRPYQGKFEYLLFRHKTNLSTLISKLDFPLLIGRRRCRR